MPSQDLQPFDQLGHLLDRAGPNQPVAGIDHLPPGAVMEVCALLTVTSR